MDKREIYRILASNKNVVASSPIQLRTRCFICGDSKKNPNKKRLGIKIDVNNPKEPILYNCFNCFAKGVFTPNMLREMDIFDKELEQGIRQLNHSAMNDSGNKVNRYKNKKEIPVEIPPLYNTDINIAKIKYLYNRLGCKIPIEDFKRLKLIFNLGEFLAYNKIQPVNEHVPILSRDYIGFLSVNNEYVILRDITNTHKMRYVKYNIFNVYDNTQSFYAISNKINLLSDDDIIITITEGPFDILGVMYNVLGRDISNRIMVAACNGNFVNTIMYYIQKGIVGSNVKIECYQDNDTRMDFRHVRSHIRPYIMKNNNFTVYYNTKSKDFGVPKSCIERDTIII